MVQNVIQEACKEKRRETEKGEIKNRPIRAMGRGNPMWENLHLLIRLRERLAQKQETSQVLQKGKQWIRLNKNVELLDTPGILWPKFEDQEVGKRFLLLSVP